MAAANPKFYIFDESGGLDVKKRGPAGDDRFIEGHLFKTLDAFRKAEEDGEINIYEGDEEYLFEVQVTRVLKVTQGRITIEEVK